MRVGMGYDVHRLVEERDLILGGVKIPYERGCWGIRMRMYCSMRLWMHCWERLRLETLEDIFRTRIRLIRGYPVFGF